MENLELQLIGEKLKALRKAKGYTSHETFAYDKNLPRAYYWKIEAGKTNITINSLLKILNIHNISLHDFFSDDIFKS